MVPWPRRFVGPKKAILGAVVVEVPFAEDALEAGCPLEFADVEVVVVELLPPVVLPVDELLLAPAAGGKELLTDAPTATFGGVVTVVLPASEFIGTPPGGRLGTAPAVGELTMAVFIVAVFPTAIVGTGALASGLPAGSRICTVSWAALVVCGASHAN